MTEDQLKVILTAVEKTTKKSDNAKMSDNLVRIGGAVALGLITWIFTTTQKLENKVGIMQTTQEFNTVELKQLNEKFNTFSEKPRFTQENFNRQISPVLGELEKINDELESREDFMNEAENKFQSLELQMSVLQNQEP